ncbi:hypothetical protein HF086_016215 [Spodoptera exigua]|uniref:Reverse transcriptase domain-containing protein n=1 Tax=Spodoptera exigua TaxID=7107 RepID=A0A922MIA1_SPOEX|nr:hypothetical protein HF086_016215 [Spodoptera exigua]
MMENAAGSIQLVVFADDTNAVVSADNISNLNTIVNQTLDIFHSWFAVNGLKINASKTNVMLFRSTSKNKDSIQCEINGEKVNVVEVVKFLGVYIDSQLKWKEELNYVVKAISPACYVLRSLRNDVTIKHLKMVYYALVESRLRYSILFWGGSYDYNIQKAFVIQKRAVRTMVRIQQQESCKPHFTDLNILTVPSLYVLVLLTHLSKYIFEYETEEERLRRESTRRKDLQLQQVTHLNVAKHSSFHKSLKLFNRLPTEIKGLVYKSEFHNKLKQFLLKKCLYHIDEL